jgi:hypothetical protein
MGLTWRRELLAADTDGFWSDRLIVVNQSIDWPARVEFTLFHEIMHFLLDEDGELIDFFTDTLPRDQSKYQSAIERCCNQGAAEFLMPQSSVRDLIAERGFSVIRVKELADQTGASLVAAAAQIAVCAPIDCFVTICRSSGSATQSSRSGLWIEYAFAPHRGKYTLARFSSVPTDHLTSLVVTEGRPVRARSFVPFRTGTRMPCTCDATLVGSRVVAILELEQQVPPGQQALPL